MKKTRTIKFSVAKRMPPLKHSFAEKEFNIFDSEVVKWLLSQKEILQYVFDKARESEIIYDSATSTWKGIEFDGNN